MGEEVNGEGKRRGGEGRREWGEEVKGEENGERR